MICWGTGEAVKILLLKPGTLTSREMIWIYRIEQESRVWIPDRHWKMFVPHIIRFASLKLSLRCESLIIQSSSTFLKRSFCTSVTCFIIIITIDNQIYSKHAVLQPGCPSVAGRQGQKGNSVGKASTLEVWPTFGKLISWELRGILRSGGEFMLCSVEMENL